MQAIGDFITVRGVLVGEMPFRMDDWGVVGPTLLWPTWASPSPCDVRLLLPAPREVQDVRPRRQWARGARNAHALTGAMLTASMADRMHPAKGSIGPASSAVGPVTDRDRGGSVMAWRMPQSSSSRATTR